MPKAVFPSFYNDEDLMIKQIFKITLLGSFMAVASQSVLNGAELVLNAKSSIAIDNADECYDCEDDSEEQAAIDAYNKCSKSLERVLAGMHERLAPNVFVELFLGKCLDVDTLLDHIAQENGSRVTTSVSDAIRKLPEEATRELCVFQQPGGELPNSETAEELMHKIARGIVYDTLKKRTQLTDDQTIIVGVTGYSEKLVDNFFYLDGRRVPQEQIPTSVYRALESIVVSLTDNDACIYLLGKCGLDDINHVRSTDTHLARSWSLGLILYTVGTKIGDCSEKALYKIFYEYAHKRMHEGTGEQQALFKLLHTPNENEKQQAQHDAWHDLNQAIAW